MSWSQAVPWEAIMNNNNSTYTGGTQSRRRNISQAGFDKIIYDVLSSDKGLAALAEGENMSGGYGSSTKGLMAQDLVTKLAGELAVLTAEEVTTSSGRTDKRSALGGQVSVICTELNRQGLLSDALYKSGHSHFLTLPIETIYGYQWWAVPIVRLMQKSKKLSKLLAPLAIARYEHIIGLQFRWGGLLTIWAGQPICYLLGKLRLFLEGKKHVNFA